MNGAQLWISSEIFRKCNTSTMERSCTLGVHIATFTSGGNPESQKESQRTPKTNSVEIRESQGNPKGNPKTHF